MLPDSHDLAGVPQITPDYPCNSRGNLGFQLYTEAAKPGGDTIQPDALNHHTLGEEHFLVDTKDPQPAKDVGC
jgi:hypothetical protein